MSLYDSNNVNSNTDNVEHPDAFPRRYGMEGGAGHAAEGERDHSKLHGALGGFGGNLAGFDAQKHGHTHTSTIGTGGGNGNMMTRGAGENNNDVPIAYVTTGIAPPGAKDSLVRDDHLLNKTDRSDLLTSNEPDSVANKGHDITGTSSHSVTRPQDTFITNANDTPGSGTTFTPGNQTRYTAGGNLKDLDEVSGSHARMANQDAAPGSTTKYSRTGVIGSEQDNLGGTNIGGNHVNLEQGNVGGTGLTGNTNNPYDASGNNLESSGGFGGVGGVGRNTVPVEQGNVGGTSLVGNTNNPYNASRGAAGDNSDFVATGGNRGVHDSFANDMRTGNQTQGLENEKFGTAGGVGGVGAGSGLDKFDGANSGSNTFAQGEGVTGEHHHHHHHGHHNNQHPNSAAFETEQ